MHTINSITGQGVYFIPAHPKVLIRVYVLVDPAGGYANYSEVGGMIPPDAHLDVADCLRQIAARVAWLNERGRGAGKAAATAVSGDVTGVAV